MNTEGTFKVSQELGELLSALSAAQGEVEDVPMDGKNPHFNSRYATLQSVLGAARGPLAKHGLSITVLPQGSEIVSTIGHKSGQYIMSRMPLPEAEGRRTGIQQLGSILTYMRRYIICGALQIVGDEDLDGNGHTEATPAASKPAARKKPAPAKKAVTNTRLDPKETEELLADLVLGETVFLRNHACEQCGGEEHMVRKAREESQNPNRLYFTCAAQGCKDPKNNKYAPFTGFCDDVMRKYKEEEAKS